MALIKKKSFFVSLMILVAFFGAAVGGAVHKVGDSKGWTMMGVNYDAWASSRTFQVGDSLVFEYNKDYHDVSEVTPNNFELCVPTNPLERYETGSDTVTLTKAGVHNFICGFPDHCGIGQKLQIVVLPASLGPVAAPIPRPVRSPSLSLSPSPSPLANSPVNNDPRYLMGPAPAPHSAASNASSGIGSYFLISLLPFFILF
ncbi:Cupredoxin superfamily protein [Raphanus sativus]|uniref:Mavicyanin-like n=1 Tax=Raphanus sativus TaxID=3726 RepID=A0A9W3BY52_RAPSA|nr:mavicyanin-like [Raphanus sativus]KAJ4891366.1 Cupredoxin superfamily protein [Raphanus sativus]